MICIRCGYCCIMYNVAIIDNPDAEWSEENFKLKPSGERCQHLVGTEHGKLSCSIHDCKWYDRTPCHDFGQIEASVDTPCRMGVYILKGNHDLIPLTKEGD